MLDAQARSFRALGPLGYHKLVPASRGSSTLREHRDLRSSLSLPLFQGNSRLSSLLPGGITTSTSLGPLGPHVVWARKITLRETSSACFNLQPWLVPGSPLARLPGVKRLELCRGQCRKSAPFWREEVHFSITCPDSFQERGPSNWNASGESRSLDVQTKSVGELGGRL